MCVVQMDSAYARVCVCQCLSTGVTDAWVCVHIVMQMCVHTRVCACKYVVKVCGVCVSDG